MNHLNNKTQALALRSQLDSILKNRIMILDGAMGTMIQAHDFSEEQFRGQQFKDWDCSVKGNNDMLSITQPEAISEIHRAYYAAGADIVETNTFNSTTIAMADYGMEAHSRAINFESAKLARQVADEFTAQNPDKPNQ